MYTSFTKGVAEGRDMSVEAVDKIGKGRVWTGAQGKELGLVDELGDLDRAVEVAKQLAGDSGGAERAHRAISRGENFPADVARAAEEKIPRSFRRLRLRSSADRRLQHAASPRAIRSANSLKRLGMRSQRHPVTRRAVSDSSRLAASVILMGTARYPRGPRERSAKPPFVGSNPTRASKIPSTRMRPMTLSCRAVLVVLALTLTSLPVFAQGKPGESDIPAEFKAPTAGYDYTKRVEMIPMRDGVKLYTVIVIPKGASHAPILLTRTPYNAKKRASRSESPYMIDELGLSDEVFVKAGYIRVYQDVRGKYGSEGAYIMVPPPIGPLNSSGIDDTTDAYDTIDWLVKNLRESNGKVGMIGSSYEGFTVVMALIHPHPALKVTAPESPMVDGWMGDDWFHYGAFRQNNLDYIAEQTAEQGEGKVIRSRRARRLHELSRKGIGGRFCAGGRIGSTAILAARWRSIRLTMHFGRGRRSTKSWRRCR